MARVPCVIGLTLAAALGMAAAPPAGVGVAVANGSFEIDKAQVFRNGTVFDGSSVQTNSASAELRLSSGSRIRIAPLSQVRARRDGVEALGLLIKPASGSSAVVSLEGGKQVHVAALEGTVVVAKEGIVLSRLETGRALQFDPPESGATSTRVIGKVVKIGGKYLLKDDTSNATFDLVGTGLDAYVGKTVAVTGTAQQPVDATANPVLKVTDVSLIPTGTGAAPAGVAHSSVFSTKVIVAGVAIAAGGTAAGVALTRGDSTPISR